MAATYREKRIHARTFKQLPRQVRQEISDRNLTHVFAQIARKHHATVDEVFSRNMSRHLANARCDMYMYLAVEAKWGMTPIAELFGRSAESIRSAIDGRLKKANGESTRGVRLRAIAAAQKNGGKGESGGTG